MKTLDLLRGTYGTCAIPFEAVCREIGMALQTGRHRIVAKTFPVKTYLEGKRRFAHIADLAEYLDSRRLDAAGKRRPGRPTNASKLAAQVAVLN